MAIPNLSDIKTRLILFGSLVTGGAVYAANAAISGDHTLWQAGIPALMTIVAGLSNELTGGDLGELIKNRGRARDILENEHLTRVVGLTIAALIDEASTDPRFAADKKRLEAIAKHVKGNWKDVPVRLDGEFTDLSAFQLPTFLTGNAETFLQVTALTPKIWQSLLSWDQWRDGSQYISGMELAPETVQGVSEKLHKEFAHALFNALAADAVKNGEAYSKIVLLMLGEILSTNQQTKSIAEQIFAMLGETKGNTEKILTDTGDLLIKAIENEKRHELLSQQIEQIDYSLKNLSTTIATEPNHDEVDILLRLSPYQSSFYFQSWGVKSDHIATIFVVWIEIVNHSNKPTTILDVRLSCRNWTLINEAKPKNLPYSNVTYLRRTPNDESRIYIEFDPINYNFAFDPYIRERNLRIDAGLAISGSMIFWICPPDTRLSGILDCELTLRTSRGDVSSTFKIDQHGV